MSLQSRQVHPKAGSLDFKSGLPISIESELIMQDAKINRAVAQPLSFKILLVAIFFIGLLGIGLYVKNVYKALQPHSFSEGSAVISQAVLEEKYGLRVNLAAVTAAGGMVDVRLKILDGEKAKLLLADKNNFPVLLADDGRVVLHESEYTKSQELKLESDGNIFLLFSNIGGVVKPGSSVTLKFGEIALEAITSR
jgi:hypothetical protein